MTRVRLARGRFPIHGNEAVTHRSFRQRHNASADDDEGSSQQDHRSGFLAESEPGDQLRHDEEKGHVYAQKPPEVPRRGVDRVP